MYGVKNASRRLKKGRFNYHSWKGANTEEALMRHAWYRKLKEESL